MFLSAAAADAVAVHTTGVNWQGVAAVATAVVVLMTPVLGFAIWLLRQFIESGIDRALLPIVERLNSIDTRVARLEGREDGKRFQVDQDHGHNLPP